ncbi:hypothetical protein NDU88_000248 [Pleurodeles waltl]|uniref:Uncharacterized protein n=1 Tax=Pleurodeles waltl TaxID=8319 RepID=A0AAV7N7I1_PLEWA|nr:hypothetical protein NDU88_000248 [Pleurodeles waltl]
MWRTRGVGTGPGGAETHGALSEELEGPELNQEGQRLMEPYVEGQRDRNWTRRGRDAWSPVWRIRETRTEPGGAEAHGALSGEPGRLELNQEGQRHMEPLSREPDGTELNQEGQRHMEPCLENQRDQN